MGAYPMLLESGRPAWFLVLGSSIGYVYLTGCVRTDNLQLDRATKVIPLDSLAAQRYRYRDATPIVDHGILTLLP